MIALTMQDAAPMPGASHRDGSIALTVGLVVLLALAALSILGRAVRSFRERRARNVEEPAPVEVPVVPVVTLPALELAPEPAANGPRCKVPGCSEDATHPRPRVEYAVAPSKWKPAPVELCASHARRAAARASAFDAALLERLASDGTKKRTSIAPSVRTVRGGRS
jgi:hypothetical protein